MESGLTSSGVEVAAVGAQGPQAPSFRVRTVIPRGELLKHGVLVSSYTLFTEREAEVFGSAGPATRALIFLRSHHRQFARLRRMPASISVALIERQADIYPSLKAERTALGSRRLVYDVDDAIWLAGRQAGGHRLAFLKGSARKVAWLASCADHVIAGNEILADHLSLYAERLTVVPSLVDHRALPLRRHRDTKKVVLGWIGSQTTAPYLCRLGKALSRLRKALPDYEFKLEVVGGSLPSVDGVETESVPWSEAAETEALGTFDVGLMPLPHTDWARGKCAYKALQYMAAGVPVVADDVGIAAKVIGHGHAGIIATGDEQWVDALVELARNVKLREQMGANGRARVEAEYSVTRWAPTLAAILREQL